ncbi:hypothetical protein F100043J3_38540 [Mediterraneibacter gnavus]|nr:hypothetical protein CLONEX_03379 [[Clostridium] nexile DSM 1787]
MAFLVYSKKYLERRLCTKAEKFVSKVAQQAGNTYLLSFKIKKGELYYEKNEKMVIRRTCSSNLLLKYI